VSKTENLRVGEHIIITRIYAENTYGAKPMYDGVPWMILAINTPFLLVRSGPHVRSIDSRECDWTMACDDYLHMFNDHVVKARSSVSQGESRITGSHIELIENSPEIEHKFPCPQCNGPMREMLAQRGPGWFLKCPECGFEGRAE